MGMRVEVSRNRRAFGGSTIDRMKEVLTKPGRDDHKILNQKKKTQMTFVNPSVCEGVGKT